MNEPVELDFSGLLQRFLEREIEFVVIGGVSASLQGVPANTFDLDLVLEPSSDNLDRAILLLGDLDAKLREHLPLKVLRPTRSDLETDGAILLLTRLGPLDLLGRVATGWGYAELLTRSLSLTIGPTTGPETPRLHVLDLPALIEIKERVGRPKDLAVLPLYRQTLAERGLDIE